MRTTLDIDDTLLRAAQLRFPSGTPKTVIIEEGLRRLLSAPASPAEISGSRRLHPAERPRDPRLEQLVRDGILRPATMTGLPPSAGGLTLAQLLDDLDADRADT